MQLMFVCTGNICRSPVGERLTTAWAAAGLGAASASVRVRSAGTGAEDGRPMDPRSAAALHDLGGDATGFASRVVLPRAAESMDLTFTMTRRQRHRVLKHSPRALRRMFTLAEAHALLAHAEVSTIPQLPLEERAVTLAALLNDARPLRPSSDDDDIADPIGQSARFHHEVATQIASMMRPIADLLFAPTPGPARGHGHGQSSNHDTGELTGPFGRPVPTIRRP